MRGAADATVRCPDESPTSLSGTVILVGACEGVGQWLSPRIDGLEQIWLVADTWAPEVWLEIFESASAGGATVHMVARDAEILRHLGIAGDVDPLLGCAAPLRTEPLDAGARRPRCAVFMMPLGGTRDHERFALLEWLRTQGCFLRILYPGRLPSRHVADESEHLVGLASDWADEWTADLDALIYWGGGGRAHQFDGLLVEARAAGLRIATDGHAQTAGSGGDEVFFGADDARAGIKRMLDAFRGEL
jgi:hypothetical protein